MLATSGDIKESLKQWEDRLNKAHSLATQFDRDYKNFSLWITDSQKQLDHDEGIRATVEGMERQIQKLKV